MDGTKPNAWHVGVGSITDGACLLLDSILTSRRSAAGLRTLLLFLAVFPEVDFGCLFRVVSGVSGVGSRCMSVVRRLLVVSRLVMFGRLGVMPRSMS